MLQFILIYRNCKVLINLLGLNRLNFIIRWQFWTRWLEHSKQFLMKLLNSRLFLLLLSLIDRKHLYLFLFGLDHKLALFFFLLHHLIDHFVNNLCTKQLDIIFLIRRGVRMQQHSRRQTIAITKLLSMLINRTSPHGAILLNIDLNLGWKQRATRSFLIRTKRLLTQVKVEIILGWNLMIHHSLLYHLLPSTELA